MAKIQKRWAISDIHGCGRQFIELLDHVDPDPEEMVIVGDLGDRGLETWEVYEEIAQLVDEGCDVVMGNHDDWFMKLRDGNYPIHLFHSPEVGGITTTASITLAEKKHGEKHVKDTLNRVFHAMKMYVETDRYIFVHAGIDPRVPFMNQQKPETLLMGSPAWKTPALEHCYEQTIVFGHTPTPSIHKDISEYDARIWSSNRARKMAIDTGAGFGMRLTLADLMEGTAYAYDFAKRKVIEYRFKRKEKW